MLKGFNPCFDGMRELNSIKAQAFAQAEACFNPCFDGMRELNNTATYVSANCSTVSILVLME